MVTTANSVRPKTFNPTSRKSVQAAISASMILFFLLASFVCVFAEEVDLSLYEKSIYSQNGEDGVLAKIFQMIEPETKYCVDFGAYDGITGSNSYLLRSQGWKTLLMDRLY